MIRPRDENKLAMKYDGTNLVDIVNNFGFDDSCIKVDFASKSVKFGKNHNSVKVTDWIVFTSHRYKEQGFWYEIISDEIVQNILKANK